MGDTATGGMVEGMKPRFRPVISRNQRTNRNVDFLRDFPLAQAAVRHIPLIQNKSLGKLTLCPQLIDNMLI